MAPKTTELNPLQRRHEAAIAELKRVSDTCNDAPHGTWLRRMAYARRVLAIIYREASDRHRSDTIEWHGLREVSLLLENYAATNLTAAYLHDLDTERSTQESDA